MKDTRRITSDVVRFRIGPVAAASARSWLGPARQNFLRVIDVGDDTLPFKLPRDVSGQFIAVLDAWTAVADPPPDAAPFADALRASMLRSLGGHEFLDPLARFVSNLQGPP